MPHIVLEDKRQICVLEACIFTTADKYCFLWWPLPGVREETRLPTHAETLAAVEARMPGPAMEAVVLESQCAGVPGPAEAISRGSCSGYLGSRWIPTPVMD